MRGSAARFALQGVAETQQYLRQLSRWSGGLPFLNNNDLERGIDRAYREAREYYLIGYAPSGSRKGAFNRIQVETSRRGVNLRFREGYYHSDTRDILTGI